MTLPEILALAPAFRLVRREGCRRGGRWVEVAAADDEAEAWALLERAKAATWAGEARLVRRDGTVFASYRPPPRPARGRRR